MVFQWLPLFSTLLIASFVNNAVAIPRTIATCSDPIGWQYGIFNNTQGPNSGGTYPSFDPTYLKSTSAGGQGAQNLLQYNVTTVVSGINVSDPTVTQVRIYKSNPINSTYFTVLHRGYLYAAATGSYNLTITAADELAIVWVGNNAKTGWTRQNANLTVPYASTPGSLSIYAAQGQYVPVRTLFAQAQGLTAFAMTITAPNGRVLLNDTYSDQRAIVKYSCDGTTATPFANNWGEEV